MDNYSEIIRLMRDYETTVVLGSGFYKELGYYPYHDYQPYRYISISINNKEEIIVTGINWDYKCKDIVVEVTRTLQIIEALYDHGLIDHLIDVSPYCLTKCYLGEHVLCLLHDDEDEKLLTIGSCLSYGKYRDALLDLMASDTIIIMGILPHLSPINTMVVVPKIKDARLIVVDSSYNPYCEIADICVNQSIIGFLRNIHEYLGVSL